MRAFLEERVRQGAATREVNPPNIRVSADEKARFYTLAADRSRKIAISPRSGISIGNLARRYGSLPAEIRPRKSTSSILSSKIAR